MKTNLLSSSLLSWLRCFEAVARQQSFTSAAAELCITQSAVSQQIKKLEQRLGVGLIERSKQGITLTVEGNQLYIAARASFARLTEIIESFESHRSSEFLELVSAPSFALRWLMPKLANFYSRHPRISLRVRADFHTLEYGMRSAEQGVMALVYSTKPRGVVDAVEILDEWLTPVASPRFLAEHPHIRSANDIEAVHMLHDDVAWRGASPYVEWDYWLKKAGIVLRGFSGGQRYNLSTLAMEAALADQGIALGRAALITDDLQAKRLVCLFDSTVVSPASYWLVSSSKPSSQTEMIAQWLRAEAQDYRRLRSKLMAPPAFR